MEMVIEEAAPVAGRMEGCTAELGPDGVAVASLLEI
jgi:hypothetical protein